jgi:hypothetical protein
MEDGSASNAYNEALVGMQIGLVYRFTVADIPNFPGVEIFPTVELIDRLYPPAGMALRYPVPIELTQDELELAARGAFVTRVIYVEDPHQALPVAQNRDSEQPWVEAAQGDDPLVAADRFGRPIAILRIGGRVPSSTSSPVSITGGNSCGPPPLMLYDAASEYPPNCPDIVPDVAVPAKPSIQFDRPAAPTRSQP